MKTKKLIFISFLVLLFALSPNLSGQNNTKEKPYSLEKDKQFKEALRKSNLRYVPDSYIEKKISNLYDEDEYARIQTAISLGRIDSKVQIPVLENMLLTDPSSEVREQCALSLTWLKSYSSIPVLIKALDDPDNKVKLTAARALAGLREKEKSLEALEELWKLGDAYTTIYCVFGFTNIATPRAVENLRKAAKFHIPNTAVGAAIALAKLEYYDDAFPLLKDFLSHEDKYIRSAAITGLAFIGDKKSLNLILKMMNDKEPYVRRRSEFHLKKFGIEP